MHSLLLSSSLVLSLSVSLSAWHMRIKAQRESLASQEESSHQEQIVHSTLILGLPASTNVRNKFLLFTPPNLQQPKTVVDYLCI